MGLDSFPAPSLNPSSITKLDLSSNNLQALVNRKREMRMEQGLVNRKKWVLKRENEKGEEKVVDLSGMGLDSFPAPSLNPSSITKLGLSSKNSQMIPESLTARLVNVVILDVHSNQLKALPNSIGCLSKLKHLNVSSNLLVSLPRSIENCRCICRH